MNDAPYRFCQGTGPLLVSIPHDGREVPAEIAARMSAAGRALPDTDWHVSRLYGFAEAMNVSVLEACWSRYVVDLNRPADDGALYPGQEWTGVCPSRTFDRASIYTDGREVDENERRARVESYWRPYHDCLTQELERIREAFGFALLWDAHSIRSQVPALFDGNLPILSLGTNGGTSCAAEVEEALGTLIKLAPYSSVTNDRFKGGYITRHYGQPARQVHAVQLEIAQRSYMDEKSLRYDVAGARAMEQTLQGLLRIYVEVAESLFR